MVLPCCSPPMVLEFLAGIQMPRMKTFPSLSWNSFRQSSGQWPMDKKWSSSLRAVRLHLFSLAKIWRWWWAVLNHQDEGNTPGMLDPQALVSYTVGYLPALMALWSRVAPRERNAVLSCWSHCFVILNSVTCSWTFFETQEFSTNMLIYAQE